MGDTVNIKKLKYRVINAEEYIDDDVVEYEDFSASYTLTNGVLEACLRLGIDSVGQARLVVEPVVRAWEFQAELQRNYPIIKFEFLPYGVVERPLHSPPIDSGPRLVLENRYPEAPTIRISQEMTDIWTRYSWAYFNQRTVARPARELAQQPHRFSESIQSAVYYGLTVLEARFGSRRKAAAELNLEFKILSMIGDLTSTRGDSATARKASAARSPLTLEESDWLDDAVRYSLLALGQLAAGLVPRAVAMTDLPKIT